MPTKAQVTLKCSWWYLKGFETSFTVKKLNALRYWEKSRRSCLLKPSTSLPVAVVTQSTIHGAKLNLCLGQVFTSRKACFVLSQTLYSSHTSTHILKMAASLAHFRHRKLYMLLAKRRAGLAPWQLDSRKRQAKIIEEERTPTIVRGVYALEIKS